MNFEYLKEINDDIVKQYMNLTNEVIKKTHSIGFIDGLTFDTAKKFLEDTLSKPRTALLLVFEDRRLIATGYLEDSGYPSTQHYGKISKVMVDPKFQGKSIGKKIMVELENRARELGYTHMLVSTWDIDYIVKFYKKCGYTQVGVIPEFVKYKGEFHDSHNFTKKL